MLELVERHFVQAQQETIFGEISLEAANGWDDEFDFKLEFGE